MKGRERGKDLKKGKSAALIGFTSSSSGVLGGSLEKGKKRGKTASICCGGFHSQVTCPKRY